MTIHQEAAAFGAQAAARDGSRRCEKWCVVYVDNVSRRLAISFHIPKAVHMPRPTRPHVLSGLALLAALVVAGSASAFDSSTPAARTFTSNLFERKDGVLRTGARAFTIEAGTNHFGVEGSKAPKVVASMTVSVSAAIKRRYKLTSAVIMKGNTMDNDITPKGSGSTVWRVKSTKAVATKLKGVKRINGVTFTVKYTSPVTETVTRKLDYYQSGTGTSGKNVRISSSGDTFKASDRG